jgi:NADPH:quinone reductase-like Zn-dependent oxidoreductase
MLAVTIASPGGPEVLTLAEVPDPVPGRGEVLIEVAAAGLNRADLHQRRGSYPPPAGAPDWPGLEVSGVVVAQGAGVEDVSAGGRGCARVAGGG